MEALYREHILKEPKPEPQGGFIPLGAIAPALPKARKRKRKKKFSAIKLQLQPQRTREGTKAFNFVPSFVML